MIIPIKPKTVSKTVSSRPNISREIKNIIITRFIVYKILCFFIFSNHKLRKSKITLEQIYNSKFIINFLI